MKPDPATDSRRGINGNIVAAILVLVVIVAGLLWALEIRESNRRQRNEEAQARLRLTLGSAEERARIETGRQLGKEIDETRQKIASDSIAPASESTR